MPQAHNTLTTHQVQAGQQALIAGAANTGLFTFGTVEAYAAKHKDDVQAAVDRAIKHKHELAWALPESVCIVDPKTYPDYYPARERAIAAALKLSIGDWVELAGRVYELVNAPNRNVDLKPVGVR